jgi:hypothetical protein
MTNLKTKPTKKSVREFLNKIPDPVKRRDSLALLDIMRKAAKSEPAMWGESIVGFGSYHFTYESGREAHWFLTGFSPRKQDLTLYIMSGFEEFAPLMKKLGKHKTGKACLYIKKLDDIDREVLGELIQRSVEHMKRTNR